MRRHAWWWLLAWMTFVASCAQDTQVALYLYTDLPWGPETPATPYRVLSLAVRVADQNSPDRTTCYPVPLGAASPNRSLPGSFLVKPRDGDRARTTLVEVAACRGATCLCDDAGAEPPLVVRRLAFTYPSEGTQHILVFLARACGDFVCPTGTTCAADDGIARCVAPGVSPRPGPPPTPDAGAPMDAPADGPGVDAAPEAGLDRPEVALDAPTMNDRPADGGGLDQGIPADTACPAGRSRCAGACVDLQSDRANCGGCGVRCTGVQVCASGRCQATCPYVMCGSDCVDTWASREHCGSCNNACRGDQTCQGAGCVCRSATSECGGACVDTQSDGQNCGACGMMCPSGQTCRGGQCVCATGGTTVCGASCVDVNSDANNCGRCGSRCGSGQNCVSGACRCAAGTPCGGGCVDTQTDVANCGGCGNACTARSAASATCVGGMCIYTCNPGVGDCDGIPTNGCETNTTSSSSHCGGCGRSCMPPNANGSCASSTCRISSCVAGWCDEDGNSSNGCEAYGCRCRGQGCFSGRFCIGPCPGYEATPAFCHTEIGCPPVP